MELSQYVLEVLRRDEEFVLYRGEPSNQPCSPSVLLLAPASMGPALETLRKIEHEYSLRSELDSAWAVRSLVLSEQRGQTTLVLEDPGGEPLDRFLRGPMQVPQFLRFAVGLATALGGLHRRELIHKDVKPANVLVNPATGQIRLMGFGIASRLPRERQTPEPPEFIAGTLPYMAPEQTGRMNRSIDSRSDLYALGVTFYEMAIGTLPFMASDPMELVHAHIARQPTPPCESVKSVPRAVSAIIMKLLAKAAEDRYQTAAGVERDLRRCLLEWETQNHIDEFPLGEHDTPDRLLIPEKLYGRESEIEALVAAFDRVVAGARPELVLVSGYSGIGKSSVVNELHKRLVPHRGLFASGKFDQYKRDIPYATLAQAFQSLLRPLLTKNEADLSKWRDALREALDPNGQLIVNLVPELRHIIGQQPSAPEVPPKDAQRRFHLLFRRFIKVFARPEHPLALFLDDLQWLDAATLDLLEDLLTQPDVQYLLLIGAYRDNEVDPSHPLLRKLEAIRRAGGTVDEISLHPLAPRDLVQLVADSLRYEPEHVASLAHLIHEKTAGNPFFAIQFLLMLSDEGLLAFNHNEGRWCWDLSRIHAKNYTDNVVDLMVAKLRRLPVETQNALQQLACLGDNAEFNLLRVVSHSSEEEVHAQLWEAARAGLVFRSADTYRFLHDRVQEATYSLIPEDLRTEAHLRIGRSLAAQTPPDKREGRIFAIVNQLNRGVALISSPEEREQLAELNLIAGKRAKTSTAYGSALNYLIAGATLLPADAWERRHELTFALELNRAECEFMTGALGAAEQRLNVLVTRAETTIERASVTGLRVDLYVMIDQYTRAIAVGLDYLRGLGVEWSPHPTKQDVQREYERIWSQLGSRTIEDLIELPLMTDAASLATMDVITLIAPAAFFTEPNLHDLAVCWAVNLSLERGNSDASSDAYVRLGLTASQRFGDYRAAYRFGQLAYKLIEQCGFKRFQARTYHHIATHLIPCAKHVRTARDLLRRSFQIANESGDLLYASYVTNALNQNLLSAGDALGDVQLDFEHALEFVRRVAHRFSVDIVSSQLGYVRNLRGLTHQFGSFDDAQFDENWMEGHFSENPNVPFPEWWYWILKLQAHFHAGDYTSALKAARRVERLPSLSRLLSMAADYHLFSALSHAASCDSGMPEQREEHMAALAAHHSEFIAWAETCPANFENLAALVGGEIARLEGRELDAERLYEQAIRSAGKQGFIQNEALAYEVAARFYAARGFEDFAHVYLRKARDGYLRWGADGKVHQLDQQYPQLRHEKPIASSTSMIAAPVEHLDLATVIRVSEAVAGELVLEKLIDRLMRTAIEHAGAERGVLIVPRGDELQMEAEASIGGEDVTVHLRDGTHTPAALPESLVRYVMRTQETVMLDDASSQNPFSADPYIVQRRARSILSLPLINQGKLIGILYLENNLTPRVFTPDRVTVLKVLASQAAISLENSQLYRDLEDREGKIRRLVDANILGIFIWDLEGAIVGANEAFLRMLQYGREDLLSGRVRWTDLTPAEWRERDERAVTALKGTGTVQPYEKEYFRKDGSRVPVLVGGALFQEGGNEGVAFVLDLSEQKRAEEALRSSEAYLAEAQRLSHTGSWAWSPDQDIKYWSEECYRVLGFDPRDGAPRMEELIQRIHPDDQPAFRESAKRAGHSKLDEEVDYRIVHPGGAVRDIHSIGHPVFSPFGELIERTGTVIDVTERKRAEEELRRSEMELRQMLDLTPQYIAVLGADGSPFYANRASLDYLGMSLDEWRQRRGISNEVHPDDVERLIAEGNRASSTGSAYELEVRVRKGDGGFRWFLARFNPLHDDKGQVTRWYIASTDIDDRKRAEERLQQENVALREEIDKASMFEEIVGTSRALQTVLSRISKVAPSDSTVLITGETGTGKELVARAIHRRSDRSSRVFVSVNCAAIPRELIASELFGHEKGAFTGATQQRLGRFELANGGTLFLDEVGELPSETQIALLRVLQEHEFERVGGTRPIRADVRVIAATNRDLQAAISAGSFRSDLFYRLHVFPLEVPPLRERKEDIPLLVEYFIDRYARKAGKNIRSVDKKTLQVLQSYPWPGNIRELQNVIERSVIVCETENFSVDESWLSRRPLASELTSRHELSRKFAAQEKEMIEAALRESRGRVSGSSGAAAKLGIPGSTLESKIRSLKINKNHFKSNPSADRT